MKYEDAKNLDGLEKFKDDEVTEKIDHKMEKCPCCHSNTIKETGEIKEKDELEYRIVVEKKRHRFIEYKCEECGKKFHQEIPNNLKEENQYGSQVQALQLTLMNQANVTINKAQKITYGMTNGEIDLSEGYIAKFVKNLVERVNGTVVECNTAYLGARDTTEKHKKLMEEHGWSKYFNVDIMDSEEPDMELEIPDGLQIKKDFVGKHLANYDSMVVMSHFKGHAMGGFGGALKQLSIGCASSYGKAYIHGAGVAKDNIFGTDQVQFVTSMGDAATAVHRHFKGNIVYISAMVNISIDCDCDGNASAPCMKDIGILASTDPVAIDRACLDIIYNSDDPGKEKLIQRIEEKKAIYIIETAEKLGAGTTDYELINVD